MLKINPDGISVDGDQLKFEAFYIGTTGKKKLMAFYKLASADEQEYWKKLSSPIRVHFTGEWREPGTATNLNGFNYREYLKQKGIYQTVAISAISKREPQTVSFWDLRQWLSIWRKQLLNHCEAIFKPETCNYLQALLFGFKSQAFFEVNQQLSNLGILHLFSLSGMHVAFFLKLFRSGFLKAGVTRETTFWFQLIFSIFYGGITGFSISVVRALLQMNISMGNKRFGWRLSGLDVWSLTLLSCLLFQPYLLFSTGAQFSFLLSVAILFVHPMVAGMKNRFLKSLLFSFILNLCTLPIIVTSYYEWQLLGSFFTFLFIPLFEFLLLPLLLLSFCLSPFLKQTFLIDWLELFFSFLSQLFEDLNKIAAFEWTIGKFSLGLSILLLGILIFLLNSIKSKTKTRWFCWVGLLFLLNRKYLSPVGTLAFIDVGQGDSIFIQAPFHQENILIDTGGKITFEKEQWAVRTNKKTGADYSVIPYLKSKGVNVVDKVFITHGDADHMGDLLAIHKEIPIKALYFPAGTEKKTSFAYTLQQLKASGTKIYRTKYKEKITGALSFYILAPKNEGNGENEDSLVLYTKLASQKVLFTGDLEIEGEKELIKSFPQLNIDILKAGHHGSKTSSAPLFIQKTTPRDVIISCGVNNRFGHPHEEVMKTLESCQASVFRTDQQGMVYYEWLPWKPLSKAKWVKESD